MNNKVLTIILLIINMLYIVAATPIVIRAYIISYNNGVLTALSMVCAWIVITIVEIVLISVVKEE